MFWGCCYGVGWAVRGRHGARSWGGIEELWVSGSDLGSDGYGSGGLVGLCFFAGFGRGLLEEVAGVVWKKMD